MNEVKFKANLKDVEALDERVTALEEGGGGGGGSILAVTLTLSSQTEGTLSHSWNEIRSALNEGTFVYIKDSDGFIYTPTSTSPTNFTNLDIGTDESGNIPVLHSTLISGSGTTAYVDIAQYKLEYMQ